MSDNLMSDKRHEHLLKAAEETVGLMNIGISPDAALAKVAEDKTLNDHEIDVVAHAVNNSKQLAHLQNSTGDDREGEFPLIDPENVRAYGDCQPLTNADSGTGSRYGEQETPGDNIGAKMDAPDAVGTQEEIQKEASASQAISGDYRLRPEADDHFNLLREGWELSKLSKVAEYADPDPFRHIDYYRIGVEEAKLQYLQKKEACLGAMQSVADEMRRVDAPEWDLVEKTASYLGASDNVLSMIFELAQIEKFGATRPNLSVKTAAQLKVSQRVMDLAKDCVCANTFLGEMSDVLAAHNILCEKQAQAAEDLFPKEAAMNVGEFAEPIEKAQEEFIGLTPESIQAAIGGGDTPTDAGPAQLDHSLRQEMKNTDARSQLEGLMGDDYIGGHNLPEVIEAYNSAMSVNPDFGKAELTSYIRQHLSTQGAVPLDLQIRARGGQQGEDY